jgi:hypothetical protein
MPHYGIPHLPGDFREFLHGFTLISYILIMCFERSCRSSAALLFIRSSQAAP